MKKSKTETVQHTPEPWSIDTDGDIMGPTGEKLADMHITSAPDKALMVAAPAMLEALSAVTAILETLLAHYQNIMPLEDRRNRERIVTQARATLNKADGRPS